MAGILKSIFGGGIPQNAQGALSNRVSGGDRNAASRDTVYRKPAAKAAPAKSGGGSKKKAGGGGQFKLPSGGNTASIPADRPNLTLGGTPTAGYAGLPPTGAANQPSPPIDSGGAITAGVGYPGPAPLPPVASPNSLGGLPVGGAQAPVSGPQDLGGLALGGAGMPPPPMGAPGAAGLGRDQLAALLASSQAGPQGPRKSLGEPLGMKVEPYNYGTQDQNLPWWQKVFQ